jgi:hypothetical protein
VEKAHEETLFLPAKVVIRTKSITLQPKSF